MPAAHKDRSDVGNAAPVNHKGRRPEAGGPRVRRTRYFLAFSGLCGGSDGSRCSQPSFCVEAFGHIAAAALLYSPQSGAWSSLSTMAAIGHSGRHAPQSMHVSGLMTIIG